jgi:hypothetical protein
METAITRCLKIDVPVVCLRDRLDDGKAKAISASDALLVSSAEWLQQTKNLSPWNRRAGVGYFKDG